MKVLTCFIITLNFVFVSNAFTWYAEWDKTFGGMGEDLGRSVAVCSDGGFIITGETNSSGGGRFDVGLIKTDSTGNMQWSKTFGGTLDDESNSVAVCSDGGFIVTGRTSTINQGDNVLLIKTDADGNKQWDRNFNGYGIYSYQDGGNSVAVCSDGGYIITGYTPFEDAGNDIWLIKTDAAGNKQWDKIFSKRDYNSRGMSVAVCSDSGYIVTGYLDIYGPFCYVWLIKTDSAGNMQWEKLFGGVSREKGNSVAICSDGGYIITGETGAYPYDSDSDVWLIKTDAAGNKQWDKTFGGMYNDVGNSVAVCSDGGYIITGYTDWEHDVSDGDLWLIKVDANGNKQWDRNFGGSGEDFGYSVQQTIDEGYIISGETWSYGAGRNDAWLIKTDENGMPVEVFDFTATP